MSNIFSRVDGSGRVVVLRKTLECLLLAGALQLLGCKSMEYRDLAADAPLLERSADIPVFTDGEVSAMPNIQTTLGELRADSCKYRYSPPSVGRQASLAQLRARAAMKGANGIAHLRYLLITNSRSPCWHGVEASGVAVVFDAARARPSRP